MKVAVGEAYPSLGFSSVWADDVARAFRETLARTPDAEGRVKAVAVCILYDEPKGHVEASQ